MHARRWFVFLAVVFWRLTSCSQAGAIDASNVLVLYNPESPNGLDIANYYAQVHPGVQLQPISGITTIPGSPDDITADNYLSEIRPQVLSALTPATSVIVTTQGMPLRIDVTEAEPVATPPNLPTYVDPAGTVRQILNWSATSSLESELTSINKISTWQMMGDQSYLIPGQFTSNPYYRQSGSFSSATYGTYLTSRLDGFTVNDVKASIARAQTAFIGPPQTPNGPFHFIVDNDPSKTYAPSMASLVNNVLNPAGLPVTSDNTSAFVSTAPGPVIGYDSFGGNQSSTPANYILSGLNITLANGAVFNSWESFNAQSFTVGGNHGNQGLIAEWLAKGGTAGVGNVAEPGANIYSVANEDQLFQMLLAGKTFAEAAWSSLRQLSYVNTVVGDPLMTWKQLLPGDVNLDGRVDNADLALLAGNWGQSTSAGGYGWGLGDMNGDGVVDLSDLALMGSDWGQIASWATVGPQSASLAPAFDSSIHPAPEPPGMLLLAMGIASMVCCRRRRGERRAHHNSDAIQARPNSSWNRYAKA
jgi:uncharacterized protein (TIGR03790 family)